MTTEQLFIRRASSISTAVALTGTTLPEEIQWMPPGVHEVTAVSGDGKPWKSRVTVNESLANLVRRQFKAYMAKAEAGEEDKPFLDFNHEDGAASAQVVDAFWGGNDPKTGGIRLKVDWTEPGKQALLGRAFRRFSPEFYTDKQNNIAAIGINMGGLVNKAAFKKMDPIWSREGGDPSEQTNQNKNMKPVEEQLAETNAALNRVTEHLTRIEARLPAQAGQTQAAAAASPELTALQSEVKGLKDENQKRAKQHASTVVRRAVLSGRIPPQDVVTIEKWTNIVCADADNEVLLEALPVQAALKKALENPGAGSTTAGAAGEHAFVVKAKDYAKANNITDLVEAQTKFAGTTEGSELYKQFRETLQPAKE
jgi:hypothetical protein